MNSRRIIALKRISNDMKELTNCPLEGIGIVQLINDPFKFVINMELMSGPYVGYKLQLLMTVSEDYPINPPKVEIYPNQLISSGFHHHIIFGRFCINLLQNVYGMNINEEYTGWNPAYSISSILLQIQNFISDPDGVVKSEYEINNLMNSMANYKRTFDIIGKDGNRTTITHTWKAPYPKMYYKNNGMDLDESSNVEDVRKIQAIKENLTCYVLRDNYIDNQEILLGYPIVQSKSLYGKDKIELYPIPQLLTYEGYQLQTSKYQNPNSIVGSFYSGNSGIKAANNQYFNNWLPIYINEDHFNKNRDTIINSLKAIKNEVEFKPEQIFDILPIILNKMIIGMFNGKSILSSAFITCYFHYVLLFKRLCKEYNEEYESYVNKKLNLIRMNDYEINKKIIPDIGDFFMLIFLSNKDMSSSEMSKVRKLLVEEFFTRQIYWIFHGPECAETMKSKLFKCNLTISNKVYLDRFSSDPNFKMRYLDIFNKELHNQNVYNQIINIISNDYNFLSNYNNNFKYARRMAKEQITKSFKNLYNQCSNLSRSKINQLILRFMNFSDFFEEDKKEMNSWIYQHYNVNDFLKAFKNEKENENLNEVLKYAYESQRGNQLLLITFYALKKIKENGFMEELEKNYGIYLKVDDFMNELKKKLNEIKTYKSLYDYIGTEFGKDKSDLELLIEGYERAKTKGYVRDPNQPPRSSIIPKSRGRGYHRGYGNAGWSNHLYDNYGY